MPKASSGLWLAVFLSAAASAADRVDWMSVIEPPSVVAEGPSAGQGGEELDARILARELPRFDWKIESARPLRVIHEMETRDGVCSFGFIPLPGRERTMVFNLRPILMPGYGVIVREDRLADFQPYLGADGAIDLVRFRDAPLTGGYVGVRPHVDALKDFIEDNHRRVRLIPAGENGSVFKQVIGRRTDFALVLRDEANYFAEQAASEIRLVSLPITGPDRWTPAYIGCSSGPVGRRVMAAIDVFLADDRHWAEFLEPWRRWLSPEDYNAALIYHTSPVR